MITPLNDRIIVQRDEEKDQMKNGLYIPDNAREKPQQGTVLAVGEGKVLENGTRIKVGVSVGSQVLFGKYAGTEIVLDDVQYLILREDDILGIITPKTKSATR